jgi:short-subunit dehydrogenase
VEKRNAVWITGASSGIGKSIATLFAEKGQNVIVSSRDGNELKKYLASKNENIFAFPLDISDAAQIKTTYSQIKESFFVTALVNNAGITSFKPVVELTDEEVQKILATNLTGAINLIRAVLPEMIARNEGTIINILSVAADNIFKNASVYSASKSGLKTFTKILREEVREYSIRVINVYPGATRTPIWPSDVLEKFADKMMSPDDVAKVVFNVSENNSNLVEEEIVLRPITGDLKL